MSVLQAVFAITAIASNSNFFIESQARCLGASYSRHINTRLRCGIFQTLVANALNCRKQCVATLNCFSVNLYLSDNGTEICELVNGTKYSFNDENCSTKETLKEHNELEEITSCSETGTCINNGSRKALPDGWYQLGSSAFKHFTTKKTWKDANDTCSANKASLAVIDSELEKRQIVELFLKASEGIDIQDKFKPQKYWRLDGTDHDVVLYGGAFFDFENAALKLPGTKGSYATTPVVTFSTTSYTIAVWIKLDSPASNHYLYSYWYKPWMFNFGVYRNKIRFQARKKIDNKDLVVIYGGSVRAHMWTHAAVTWNSTLKQFTVYQDGVKMASNIINSGNIALPSPTRSVYDVGFKRDSQATITGLIRELVVFNRSLNTEEIQQLKDDTSHLKRVQRVWIGQQTGKYNNLLPNIKSSSSCTSARAWGEYYWEKVTCAMTLEFVCKKLV